MGGNAKGWLKEGRGRRGRWEGTVEAWVEGGFTSKWSERLCDSGGEWAKGQRDGEEEEEEERQSLSRGSAGRLVKSRGEVEGVTEQGGVEG